MLKLRRQKRSRLLIITGFALVLCLMPWSATEGARKGWPSRVTIGGGPLQGTYYVLAAGWSSMLNKVLKINSSVESTAGNVPNAKLMSAGKQDLGLVAGGIAVQAYNGTGFAKGTKYRNLRLIVPSQMNPLQFWTMRSSGIKRGEDIDGKRLNISRPGSAVDVIGRNLMRVTGLKPSQVVNVGHGQANRLMRDGLLDVASTVGSPPHPAIAAITSELGTIRVFGLGQGKWAKMMMKEFPQFVPSTVEGGIYKGNPDPFKTIADLNWLAAGAHAPADFVYEVTKATYAHKKDLVASHKSWTAMDASNVNNANIPIHSGAIRYYKEIGVKLP